MCFYMKGKWNYVGEQRFFSTKEKMFEHLVEVFIISQQAGRYKEKTFLEAVPYLYNGIYEFQLDHDAPPITIRGSKFRKWAREYHDELMGLNN
jgi:hypothetical protein